MKRRLLWRVLLSLSLIGIGMVGTALIAQAESGGPADLGQTTVSCSAKGDGGTVGTPSCTEDTITCPATVSACDYVASIEEDANKGDANVNGTLSFANFSGSPFTSEFVEQPDTCPAPKTCAFCQRSTRSARWRPRKLRGDGP
jgi:hypothetical protein